jgi:hypothetical protein
MTKHGLPKQWIDAHVNYDGDGCLPWPYTRTVQGYARVWHNQTMYPAHRLMCEIVHGRPPQEHMDAAHSCGNGHLGCMNHKHLRWATKAENSADRRIHGTAPLGEASHRAKLRSIDVEEIKRRVRCGERQRHLGVEFGVSEAQVSRIVNGKRWV